jgi:hypothetical protein
MDNLERQSILIAEHIIKSAGLSFQGMERVADLIAELYREQVSEREAQAVQREREATYTLVRNAYNEGFTEGMKEHTKHNGGKPWEWSDALKSVNARHALATYNDNRKG